jgi:hypothetical protein
MLSLVWTIVGVGYLMSGLYDSLTHPPVNPAWYCAGVLCFILAELKEQRNR